MAECQCEPDEGKHRPMATEIFQYMLERHREASELALQRMRAVLDELCDNPDATEEDVAAAKDKVDQIANEFQELSMSFQAIIDGVSDAVDNVKDALDRACGREPTQVPACPPKKRSWIAKLLGRK